MKNKKMKIKGFIFVALIYIIIPLACAAYIYYFLRFVSDSIESLRLIMACILLGTLFGWKILGDKDKQNKKNMVIKK